MSTLSYTKKARLGTGWIELVLRVAAVALVGLTIWAGLRIVSSLNAAVQSDAPRSTEERIIDDARQAVAQNSDSVTARWQLSLALSTIGSFEEALTEAEEAARIDGSKPEPFFALGVAYKGIDDLGRAEKAFQKAVSIPGAMGDFYREAYYELGAVRTARGNHDKAVEALEQALVNGPEATYVVIALAEAYESAGNEERAIEEYSAALGYDPTNESVVKALESLGVSDADIEAARTPEAHKPASTSSASGGGETEAKD